MFRITIHIRKKYCKPILGRYKRNAQVSDTSGDAMQNNIWHKISFIIQQIKTFTFRESKMILYEEKQIGRAHV